MTDRSFSNDSSGEEAQDSFFAPALLDMEEAVRGHDVTVLPPNCTRGDAVAILSKDFQRNSYGLPTHFVRSDLLSSISQGYITQDEVDAASVGLFYAEGYPTLEDGTAFWAQLPHEPHQAYLLFKAYVDQAEEQGIRQLDLLAASTGVDRDTLRQHYLEYYWSSRARAYDLFIVAAEERKRQLRTRRMENAHYDKAGELLAQLAVAFEDADWVSGLNAKEAVEVMIELAKLQRLSVGLTGQHASSLPRDRLPEGASVESIMEHITKGASMSQEGSDNFMGRLQALLNDPENGMQIQGAILKLGRPEQQYQRNGADMGDD